MEVRDAVAVKTDAELWDRAREDSDAAAFGLLFTRNSSAVYTHCFRLTGDWSAAEDLTSVVFLETWRRRASVVIYEASILPWLIGVANYSSRNAQRSVHRHRRLLAKLPTEEVDDPTEVVVQRVAAEQVMQSVRAVFTQLPEREQEVLTACAWAGLTYDQAAIALEVPVGTVRSRLSRARSHLKAILNAQALGEHSPRHTVATTLGDEQHGN